MCDENDRRRRLRLLEAAGMAHASEVTLDVAELSREFDVSEQTIRTDLEQLEVLGLVRTGFEEGLAPMLLTAGRQFLVRRGDVEHEVLSFLPAVIDDLNAREALLVAGTILVDEFRAALVDGDHVDYARALVPPAFATAVDERLALDLFAAAVALMARLSDGAPAGCVAEEIMAVRLIEEARAWLEMQHEQGELDQDAERAASEELRGLFELFQDDDVLNMFDMVEPGGRGARRSRPAEPAAGCRRPARGVVVRRVRLDIADGVPQGPILGCVRGLNRDRRASLDSASPDAKTNGGQPGPEPGAGEDTTIFSRAALRLSF